MATQTVYLKEHDHNPMGQLSAPWWNPFASQSVYGESCGQLKPFSMEHPSGGDQLISNKQAGRGTEHGADRGNTTPFTIFHDNCRSSGDGQKPQAAISLQSSLSEYRGRFELGFGQPMGRVMLPLSTTTDDGPIYVNAKQYHGIIRRRQSRAKAVLENKVARARRPYMHESRHLHAMRRPRGCSGRFLNTKIPNKGKGGTKAKKAGNGQLSRATRSQSSEVLQSHSGTLNSSKDANGNGSHFSGSEVTSTFCRGDLDLFPMNHHLIPSVHSLPGMMDGGRGIVMPSKWVAAGDTCCNLKV